MIHDLVYVIRVWIGIYLNKYRFYYVMLDIVIHERFDGLCWVCFDSGLDDLCYDVFIKLLMILSEHWCETSVMTFDTLDNLFLMFL